MVVVDDQELIRAGIVMLLAAQEDLDVVAEAAGRGYGGPAGRSTPPRRGADGHPDAARRRNRGHPAAHRRPAGRIGRPAHPGPGPDHLQPTTKSSTARSGRGASGFLLKHAAPADLPSAIRKVAAGEAWIDSAVAGRVIAAVARLPDSPDAR